MPVRLRVLVVLFLAVLAAALGLRLGRRDLRPAPPARVSSAGGSRLISAELAARVTALESARAEAEQTRLADEMLAQRHEAVGQRLWDQLRREPDTATVFATVKFTSLDSPALGDGEKLGGEIIHRRGDPNRGQRLTSAEWEERLAAWRKDGWRLDGSEWRHVAFRRQPGGAESTFTFELHLEQVSARLRLILRGRLQITWAPLTDETAEPAINSVRVTALDAFQRTGEPRFALVLRDVPPSEPGNEFVDPLLVQDLDGDGREDLVLAGAKRIYRNLGGGFRASPLLPAGSPPVHTALLADVDGDGHADLILSNPGGVSLVRGTGAAGFEGALEPLFTAELPNGYTFSTGDVDGDGDLDLWLVQYKVPFRFGQMPTPYFDANDGFPAYLLLNDGRGHFTDATANSGLAAKRFRRSYASSLADLDGDGDLDVVNVSDFAGVDLFLNDGHGKFTDVSERLGERRMFGMAHALADFDGDGRMDLFAVGMNSAAATRLDALGLVEPGFPQHAAARAAMVYGNRVWLGRPGGTFGRAPWNDAVAAAGWAWGVAACDADNDGDLDLYLANGHRSRASVREYDPQFWLHDLYVATSELDPAVDLYFGNKASRYDGMGVSYGGHYRNVLFQNDGAAGWHDVAWLQGVALPEDCRNVAAADLDGDGRLELIVVTEERWPQEQKALLIYRNRGEAGHWFAVRLREEGAGFSPWGAKVTVEAGGRRQTRWLVTGDGYRTQSPPVVHFGLGTATSVDSMAVTWPNGTVRRLARPDINRLHAVLGRELP